MRIWWIDLPHKSFRNQWNNQNQSRSSSWSPLVWFSRLSFDRGLANQEKCCRSLGLRSGKMGRILHAKSFFCICRSIASFEHIRWNPSRIQHTQRHKPRRWEKTIYSCRHHALCWIHAQRLPNCYSIGRSNSKRCWIPVQLSIVNNKWTLGSFPWTGPQYAKRLVDALRNWRSHREYLFSESWSNDTGKNTKVIAMVNRSEIICIKLSLEPEL